MGEGGLDRPAAGCNVTQTLHLLIRREIQVGILGIIGRAVAQLLPRVVVPHGQVRQVGEGAQHRLLQLGAVHRVVEQRALCPCPLDVVEDGEAEVRAGGGAAAAAAARPVVFVRAGQVGGAAGARH